ncbi:hypothetical protein FOA52_012889 [Chlamydomonas sp. UWO 241]|nr:hypothetical protein FOA52_012889 [Chlamydomonas sp. UWO 241]
MRPESPLTLLAAVALALCLGCADAKAPSITKWITSAALEGQNVDVAPDSIPPGCTAPGVCVPFTVTLPAKTAWYWCGWRAEQRTTYNWTSAPAADLYSYMMRDDELFNCQVPKANATNTTTSSAACISLYGSPCGPAKACVGLVLGYAFTGETCMVMENRNVNKSATFSIQVFQYYDSPRYYGMIFSIIFTILLLGGVTTYIVLTCYDEINSTPDRIREMRTFEEQLVRNESVAGDINAIAASPDLNADPGSFQGRVSKTLAKFKGLVSRGKHRPAASMAPARD